MADAADTGFMIWDTQSTGTLSNVLALLEPGKNVLVFIDKEKTFCAVKNADHLEQLVTHMSAAARVKADGKMDLNAKLAALHARVRQTALLAEST